MSRIANILLWYVFLLVAIWYQTAGKTLTAIYAVLFVLALVAIRAYSKWTEPRPPVGVAFVDCPTCSGTGWDRSAAGACWCLRCANKGVVPTAPRP